MYVLQNFFLIVFVSQLKSFKINQRREIELKIKRVYFVTHFEDREIFISYLQTHKAISYNKYKKFF